MFAQEGRSSNSNSNSSPQFQTTAVGRTRNSKRKIKVIATSDPHDETTAASNKDVFLEWCRTRWGIETYKLELATDLRYPDYIQAMRDRVDVFFGQDDNDNDDDDDEFEASFATSPFGLANRYETVSQQTTLRGLVATQDIPPGDVVIRLPRAALWTVQHVIDDHAVLKDVLGPEARRRHGWQDPVDELPLLSVALLYHIQQQNNDNSYYDYLHMLPDPQHLTEQIPHLWEAAQLRIHATPGVRRVARAIQKDVWSLYQRIVRVLIQEHGELFGPKTTTMLDETQEDVLLLQDDDPAQEHLYIEEEEEDEAEWMFSLEHFHWAFAVVNSRHWNLKLPPSSSTRQQQQQGMSTTTAAAAAAAADPKDSEESTPISEQASPPASMPTAEWLQLQQTETAREEETTARAAAATTIEDPWPSGSSFLAPVADLINFGPPCTRGIYNEETESFEIIATCPFSPGQEITFWYGDACQDVFMANYGFTHPMMVPPCVDEQTLLKQDLDWVLEELYRTEHEIESLVAIMLDCRCQYKQSEPKTTKPLLTAPSPVVVRPASEEEPTTSEPTQEPQQNHARHAIRGAEHRKSSQTGRLSRGTTTERANSRKSDL